MSIKISRILRSKRKTIALIVERDASVTVRAPMKMSVQAIQEFIEKHTKWVEKKQAEIVSSGPAQPRLYQPGETFLYLGQAYPLEIVGNANNPLVFEGSFQLAGSAQRDAETLLRNWYRKEARKILQDRVSLYAAKHEISVKNIRITSARTRWGSCSSKGTLSFSWRLLMTPLDVIDYVVIHELAHTIHHNHSQSYWDLVEKWMPDYRERKQQLRRYGQERI